VKKDWKRGQTFVAELIEALKGRSWGDLETLPPYVDVTPPTELSRFRFCQWKDKRPDGSLRIVVQQYRPGALVGRMGAEGFVVYPDGRVSDVPQEEMWEPT